MPKVSFVFGIKMLPLVDLFLKKEFDLNVFDFFVNNNENLSLLGY